MKYVIQLYNSVLPNHGSAEQSKGIPQENVGELTIWEERRKIPNVPGNIAIISIL
jgi:hypothetical protein